MSNISQTASEAMYKSAGRKNQKAIVDIAVKAKQQGMTYGQLVSQNYLKGESLDFCSIYSKEAEENKEKKKTYAGLRRFAEISPEQEKINKKVQDWAEWSMTPHSEEEIRNKCLDDIDGICFAYLCNTSYISEEFFEEFLALSTGLINRSNYNNLNYYISILRAKYSADSSTAYDEINPKVDINALDNLINSYSEELKKNYYRLFMQSKQTDLTL